jgi:hypothetical protein
VSRLDICSCKHCGRYLDGEDKSLARRIGLDADECVDQIRCIDEQRLGSPRRLVGALVGDVADAVIRDLSVLRDWLMAREADRRGSGLSEGVAL